MHLHNFSWNILEHCPINFWQEMYNTTTQCIVRSSLPSIQDRASCLDCPVIQNRDINSVCVCVCVCVSRIGWPLVAKQGRTLWISMILLLHITYCYYIRAAVYIRLLEIDHVLEIRPGIRSCLLSTSQRTPLATSTGPTVQVPKAALWDLAWGLARCHPGLRNWIFWTCLQ